MTQMPQKNMQRWIEKSTARHNGLVGQDAALMYRTVLVWTIILHLALGAISAGAQTLVATIDLPRGPLPENVAIPQEIAVDTLNNRIFAPFGHYYLWSDRGRLAVIDGSTDTLTDASLEVGFSPWGVAYNPNTQRVYVANQNGGGATVVDANALSVIGTIRPWTRTSGVAVNPVTNRIYISQEASYFVWVIDGSSDAVITTINSGAYRPAIMIANPESNKIYVANNSGSNLAVIDGNTHGVTTIPSRASRLALPFTHKCRYASRDLC